RVRSTPDDYRARVETVDLTALDGHGPACGVASGDLNATLLVWGAGEGQPRHVDRRRRRAPGRGGHARDRAARVDAEHRRRPEGLRCLTVHRRRGGLALIDFRGPGVGLRPGT